MADFKKTVMTVAIVTLIILLIILGIMMSNAAAEASWPPNTGDCPDFWQSEVEVRTDGSENYKCNNVHSLGNSNCAKIKNFSGNQWKGDDGNCRKQKWAKGCDLTWDGITNNDKVCNTEDE